MVNSFVQSKLESSGLKQLLSFCKELRVEHTYINQAILLECFSELRTDRDTEIIRKGLELPYIS
jgi:hypothetical protein